MKAWVNCEDLERISTEIVQALCLKIGGGCEIRTHGEVAPSLVFKTSAIDHSANPPMILLYISNFVEAPVITITNAYPQIIRETP